MTNRFMISVAALALVAGTGFASAQQGTMGRDNGASGSQQMQHSAQPSGGAAEHGGAMNKSEKSEMNKSGKSEKGTVGQAGGSTSSKSAAEEKSSGAMNKKESAEDKAGASKGMRSDERAQGQQDKSKGMSSENTKSGAKDMKAEGREKNMNAEGTKSGATGTNNAENRQGTSPSTSTNNAQNRQGTGTNMNAQGQPGSSSTSAQGQTGSSSTSATVGQAGAGAKLSTEQRTQITSVIREQHVAPVNNVNFTVSVGTRIPREGIELHALPSRIATIYPEWRSYKYVVVRDEIVIIDPNTYEIIAVLNV